MVDQRSVLWIHITMAFTVIVVIDSILMTMVCYRTIARVKSSKTIIKPMLSKVLVFSIGGLPIIVICLIRAVRWVTVS